MRIAALIVAAALLGACGGPPPLDRAAAPVHDIEGGIGGTGLDAAHGSGARS